MTQTKSMLALAGAALSLTGTALAEQAGAWSSANADEIRTVVAEMLADAETRSSLQSGGATAGYDKGFFLASSDGNFRLNVGGMIQFRYIIDWRNNVPPIAQGGGDDFIPGFQTRRTRLNFDGHVFDPNLFYKIEGDFSRAGNTFGTTPGALPGGGAFTLLNAYVGYKWDNGFSAQWGQFKLPLLREELVSSRYQLAVDRSFANEVFNQDYSQGIQGTWESEYLRVLAAFSDGIGSRNTDIGANPADWALTGRLEWLWSGEWKQFKDFTSPRGSAFAGLFGAAAHYEGSPDFPGAPRNHSFLYTVDLSVEGDGWNVFGAFMGANQDNGAPGAANFDDAAFVVQGGLYVTDEFEVFGRYDGIIPDGSRINAAGTARAGNDMSHVITGGFNYYLHGHAAKFTFDTVYLLSSATRNEFLSAPFAGSTVTPPYQPVGMGVGFFGPGGGSSEWIFRMQFQLLF